MLSDGTQRRAMPQHHSEEIKLFNVLFPRVGIEPATSRVYSHILVPLRHDWPLNIWPSKSKLYYIKLINKYYDNGKIKYTYYKIQKVVAPNKLSVYIITFLIMFRQNCFYFARRAKKDLTERPTYRLFLKEVPTDGARQLYFNSE